MVRQVTFGTGDILMLSVKSPELPYENELWLIQHTPKPKEQWAEVKDDRYKAGTSTDDIPVTDLTVALEFTDPDSILSLVRSLTELHGQMTKKLEPEPKTYDPKPLDEKGFVFIDGKNDPYWICMWGDSPWLFYWNHGIWVSLRKVNQTEIWEANKSRLSDEQAQHYHDQSAKTLGI